MNYCCGTCQRTLLAEDFDPDPRRPSGLSSRCKDCRRASQRAYLRRRREADKPLGRRYRASADAAFVHWLLSPDCGSWIAVNTQPFRAINWGYKDSKTARMLASA